MKKLIKIKQILSIYMEKNYFIIFLISIINLILNNFNIKYSILKLIDNMLISLKIILKYG